MLFSSSEDLMKLDSGLCLAHGKHPINGVNFFFFFLAPHPQHMLVPRLGVDSEL